jgi:hypothetical protein
MRHWKRLVLGCIVCGAAVSGCVDTTPGIYVPLERDAGVADAARQGDAQESACNLCIAGSAGPCRENYDTCQATPRCPMVIQCLLDLECFAFLKIEDRIACGTPCLDKAGPFAGNDPVITELGNLNVCTFTSCTDVCGSR